MKKIITLMLGFTFLLPVFAGDARAVEPAPAVTAWMTAVGSAATESGNADAMPGTGVWEDDFDAVEPDPFYGWNVAMFHFNDVFYFAVVKPIASAYRALVPPILRSGIRNFFDNIAGPGRMICCLAQGKGASAEAEWVRFWMNTTVGVLGLGDPAGRFDGLNPPKEDVGQTLGTWGWGDDGFIIWPVFGPSCIRDTIGLAGDRFLDPLTYVDPAETATALSAVNTINAASYRIGDYEAMKEAAIDPYEALRDAYLQLRRKQVKE